MSDESGGNTAMTATDDSVERSVEAGVRAYARAQAQVGELQKQYGEAMLAVSLAEQQRDKLEQDLAEERRLRLADADSHRSEMTVLRLECHQAVAERAEYEAFFRGLSAQMQEFVMPAAPVLSKRRNSGNNRAGRAGAEALKDI